MRHFRLSILFLLGLSAPAGAAITLNSATASSVVQGATVTVSATGLDAFESSKTVTTDNMRNGRFNPAWANTFSLKVVNNNEGWSPYDVFAATKEFIQGNPKTGKIQAASSVSDKWYAAFRIKVSTNWDWGTTGFDGTDKFLSNIKIFRLWNPGSTIENFYIQYDGLGNQMMVIAENVGESTRYTMGGFRTKFTKGVWHTLECEFMENSALSAADGYFRFKFDGSTIAAYSNIVTRVSTTGTSDGVGNKRPYIIGFENEWNCTENGGGGADASCDEPNDFSMADIHLHKGTLQRVVVSTCATDVVCPGMVVQNHSLWSGGTVTFPLDVGNNTGTLYARLYDQYGNVSNAIQIAANTPTLSTSGNTMSGQTRGR